MVWSFPILNLFLSLQSSSIVLYFLSICKYAKTLFLWDLCYLWDIIYQVKQYLLFCELRQNTVSLFWECHANCQVCHPEDKFSKSTEIFITNALKIILSLSELSKSRSASTSYSFEKDEKLSFFYCYPGRNSSQPLIV